MIPAGGGRWPDTAVFSEADIDAALMTTATWLPLMSILTSAVVSALLGRVWGRPSTVKQDRQEGQHDSGLVRELLTEPVHRPHHKFVIPGQQSRQQAADHAAAAQELAAARQKAIEAAADARRAWDDFLPGWKRHLFGNSYPEALMRVRAIAPQVVMVWWWWVTSPW